MLQILEEEKKRQKYDNPFAIQSPLFSQRKIRNASQGYVAENQFSPTQYNRDVLRGKPPLVGAGPPRRAPSSFYDNSRQQKQNMVNITMSNQGSARRDNPSNSMHEINADLNEV